MVLSPLQPLSPLAGPSTAYPAAPAPCNREVFGRLFGQAVGTANDLQSQANQSVLDLATGRTNNIHDVTVAVAKADLMFRMVLEVRNRLTEAYQEIARMQI